MTSAHAIKYGCQNMVGRLQRVIVRRPDDAFANADPELWNYDGRADLQRAAAEHDAFVEILANADVEIIYHDEPMPDHADAIYTYDSALVTDRGAIIMRMGKVLRQGEGDAMARRLTSLGIPELARLGGDARAEGGDSLWLDSETIAIGVGFRTNSEGAGQLSEIFKEIGVTTLIYDLPCLRGERHCLHLMSLVNLIDHDLAVVYLPLLPVRLYAELRARGISIIDVPENEFERQATNVLAVAPRDCVMLEGNVKTQAQLRAAGCRVTTYRGDEITLKGEGGPTCLTRPILRQNGRCDP